MIKNRYSKLNKIKLDAQVDNIGKKKKPHIISILNLRLHESNHYPMNGKLLLFEMYTSKKNNGTNEK